MCAVQAISHSCHVELLSATTSTAMQTKPQIHDLLRLHQTTKFHLSAFSQPEHFHFLWEFLSRRCRKLIIRDFPPTLVGLLVVHFKEVGKWQEIFQKNKTRNEKRKVWSKHVRSSFTAQSSKEKCRQRAAKKHREKLKWKSWSYGSDWKAWKEWMCVIIHKKHASVCFSV